MSRKKRKPAKKDVRRGEQVREGYERLPPLDWRALEGVMQQMLGGGGNTPLERAQELIYDAFEADSDEKQIALARQALKISPDCADAYVLLAEHAETLEQALALNQQGVAAGERALGKRFFRENAGQFWGLLETRPYMRARLGLAQCLWSAHRSEAALAHYRDMLRLNPGDNQGIRYLLCECLLDLDRKDELDRLLDQYADDASATWVYSRALLAFRREGDTEASRRLLRKAAESNAHVPAYLVGNKPIPRDLPEYVGFGDEDEAVSYVVSSLSAWKNTPGAITWLRRVLKVALPEARPARKPSWPRLRQKLAQVEQVEGEVWQVDVRRLFSASGGEEEETPTWGLFIVNGSDGRVLTFDVGEGRPAPPVIWQSLVDAMLEAKQGPSHRPAEIQVRLKTLRTAWQAKLRQIGIECRLCDELDHIDQMVHQAVSQLGRQYGLGKESAGPGEELPDPAELPQHAGETWQADVRRLATWVEGEGELVRPWSVLVVHGEEEKVLAQDLTLDEPNDAWFLERVLRAMRQPLIGEPHRPGVIQLRSEHYRQVLQECLDAAGVRCVACDALEQLDSIYQELAHHLSSPNQMTAVVNVPGMDLGQVGSFFAAAADFYRQTPWRMVPGDVPIEIRCSKFQSGPWYAVVMGQSGMTLGVALYEDRQVLSDLLAGQGSDEENFRRTSAISVTFNEAFDMPIADLEAAEKHAWPVAGPEAYPCAMRVNPGQSIRPPLAWELQLLEASLRALCELLPRHQRQATLTVPAAGEQLTLELTLLDDGQL